MLDFPNVIIMKKISNYSLDIILIMDRWFSVYMKETEIIFSMCSTVIFSNEGVKFAATFNAVHIYHNYEPFLYTLWKHKTNIKHKWSQNLRQDTHQKWPNTKTIKTVQSQTVWHKADSDKAAQATAKLFQQVR